MSERRTRRTARGTAPRPLSRRRFMTLLAAGSAAAWTAPARDLAAAAATTPPTKPAPSPKMLAEIEKQRKYVADTLKVIRGYPLPPGSDMAFEFRPLRAKRKK